MQAQYFHHPNSNSIDSFSYIPIKSYTNHYTYFFYSSDISINHNQVLSLPQIITNTSLNPGLAPNRLFNLSFHAPNYLGST